MSHGAYLRHASRERFVSVKGYAMRFAVANRRPSGWVFLNMAIAWRSYHAGAEWMREAEPCP